MQRVDPNHSRERIQRGKIYSMHLQNLWHPLDVINLLTFKRQV